MLDVFKQFTACHSRQVSERGDILSPKYAPDITAPAVTAGGIQPYPIPSAAIPIVPAVVHELPVAKDMIQQIIQTAARK